MMLESCSWFIKIQQKENCPKQMDYVQDISNPEGEGSMLIYLPTGRRGLITSSPYYCLSDWLAKIFENILASKVLSTTKELM